MLFKSCSGARYWRPNVILIVTYPWPKLPLLLNRVSTTQRSDDILFPQHIKGDEHNHISVTRKEINLWIPMKKPIFISYTGFKISLLKFWNNCSESCHFPNWRRLLDSKSVLLYTHTLCHTLCLRSSFFVLFVSQFRWTQAKFVIAPSGI